MCVAFRVGGRRLPPSRERIAHNRDDGTIQHAISRMKREHVTRYLDARSMAVNRLNRYNHTQSTHLTTFETHTRIDQKLRAAFRVGGWLSRFV